VEDVNFCTYNMARSAFDYQTKQLILDIAWSANHEKKTHLELQHKTLIKVPNRPVCKPFKRQELNSLKYYVSSISSKLLRVWRATQ
jgi:hypothetical protein